MVVTGLSRDARLRPFGAWRLSHAEVVLTDPRFVEVSHWPAFAHPWQVGLRLGSDHKITWIRGQGYDEVMAEAMRVLAEGA